MVTVKELTKTFVSLRQKVQAVQSVSFDIQAGEIVGFVGPNGAGKSTTIKMLMGFIRPDGGKILIGGKPCGSPEALEQIGFMPEHPSFPETLTGYEWLSYAYQLHTRSKAPRQQLKLALEEVGLDDAGTRPIRSYSKGMLQRLGLAQAVVTDPQILILDEPLSGLDPMGRTLFKDVLRRHSERGRTIFFSSHILDDVEHLCSRILMLDKGRVRIDRTTSELAALTERTHLVVYQGNCQSWQGIDAEKAGDALRLKGLDGNQLQAFLRFAAREDLTILHVESEKVRLEDLFVQLVGQTSQDAAATNGEATDD